MTKEEYSQDGYQEAPKQSATDSVANGTNANGPTTNEAGPQFSPPPPPQVPSHNRARTGPIVWGALILVFCAYTAQRNIAPGSIDTATWVIAAVIGLGVLLLGVGIAAIIRSRGNR